MCLAMAVPDRLKDRECKKIAFRECPPILCIPKNDCVQENISAFKEDHLKMQISRGAEIYV
jgi:hypothetical protein